MLSSKQRKSRRRGKLVSRIHRETGCLHFENLPTEKEHASTNTWGPLYTGACLLERHAYVKGTAIRISVFIENGERRPPSFRAMPNSIAAAELLQAGYVPTRP